MVNAGNASKIGGIVLFVMCGLPGLGMLAVGIAGLFGNPGDPTGLIISSCIGVALLPFGLYGGYAMIVRRPFRFVIDGWGVRVESTKGPNWAFAWSEIAGVWMPTATKAHGGLGRAGMHSTLVRLEFVPIDPQRFASEHPSLQRYHGRQNNHGAYRIPLGPGAGAVSVFDATLRAFARGRYRGVVDEGVAWGFRYS